MTIKSRQRNAMARFLFLRHTTIDATESFSKGCFPKKSRSFDLSQIGVSQGKNIGGFCPGPGGILHPPSRLPLGSRDMSLPTGYSEKKLRLSAESSGPLCSRSRLPQEWQESLPAIRLYWKAEIAPRKNFFSLKQGSLLVIQRPVNKSRLS